ncbi:MAG: TRAP transporter large permease subunit, partial [Oscillospiraceae bacterium]
MAMVLLLVFLLVFAFLGVPLAFSIGASCITYLLSNAPQFLSMLPQRVWNGTFSELMIAMPLFMLAGELMNTGGITKRIIDFCMQIVRPF